MPRKTEKPRNGKQRPMRSNFDRDVQMAREKLPREMGGESLTVPEIAEKHGISKWAVYKALERDDVKDVHNAWLKWAWKEHRRLGPVAMRATEKLLRDGEPSTVKDYWRRTGVSMEPSIDVNVEKLELAAPPEVLELVRRLNPRPDEPEASAEDVATAAPGTFVCPSPGCGHVEDDLAALGGHILREHASASPAVKS